MKGGSRMPGIRSKIPNSFTVLKQPKIEQGLSKYWKSRKIIAWVIQIKKNINPYRLSFPLIELNYLKAIAKSSYIKFRLNQAIRKKKKKQASISLANLFIRTRFNRRKHCSIPAQNGIHPLFSSQKAESRA